MYSFLTILLRLGLAVFLGALIGFERESREHAAGMRTNALVSLGSCLFTIISAFGFLDFISTPHVQIDPTRIASYIVAGIGFLGAGSIFLSQDKNRVKGLTTAATVWLVAAIGMACGAGLFAVSEQEGEVLQIICTIPDTATLAKVVDQLRALPGVRTVQANLQDIDKMNEASNGE